MLHEAASLFSHCLIIHTKSTVKGKGFSLVKLAGGAFGCKGKQNRNGA